MEQAFLPAQAPDILGGHGIPGWRAASWLEGGAGDSQGWRGRGGGEEDEGGGGTVQIYTRREGNYSHDNLAVEFTFLLMYHFYIHSL